MTFEFESWRLTREHERQMIDPYPFSGNADEIALDFPPREQNIFDNFFNNFFRMHKILVIISKGLIINI
jgi:hypothetical protein